MEVELAKAAGFCFGVERSIKLCNEALKKEKKVFLFGMPIHNPQVVKQLEEKGAKVINNLSEAEESGTVIIRAHGVPPNDLAEAKKRKLKIVDTTCPFVSMVQKKARELEKEGYQVVIVGERGHPEVIGIQGNAPHAKVIEKSDQVNSVFPSNEQFFENDDLWKEKNENKITEKMFSSVLPKIGVVSQTTQSDANFLAILQALGEKAREVRAFNTICNATHLRQPAAVELAKKVDLMIVVGGKNSGNTKRLFDLSSELIETRWIETVAELKKEWFSGKKSAGITAGASTPDFLIKEVMHEIKKI